MLLFRLVATLTLLSGCSLAPPPRTWTDAPAVPFAVPIAVRATGPLRGHVEFALARHPVRLVAQDAEADLVINGELLIDGSPATTLVLFVGRSDRTVAVQLSASDHAGTKRLIVASDIKSWTEPKLVIPVVPFLPPFTFTIPGFTAERSASAESFAAVVRAVDRLLEDLPASVPRVRSEEHRIAQAAAPSPPPSAIERRSDGPSTMHTGTGSTGLVTRQAVRRSSAASAPNVPVARVAAENRCQRLNITAVQLALRDLGIDPGPIDGVVGPMTRAAITRFQQMHRLPVTGEIDLQSAARLHEVDHESPLEADVETLQLALRERGIDPGPIDGIYGSRTKAAIAQFQISENLQPTGGLERLTVKKLQGRADVCG